MPIQCIGGNWATSRTFCKKIGATNNVLTGISIKELKIAVEITLRVKDEIRS